MKTTALAALAVVACGTALLVAPGAAQAQAGAGAFRVSLEGNLFSFDKLTVEAFGMDVDTKLKRYGILDAGLGIGAFGAVTDSLLIGGRFHFAGQNEDEGDSTISNKRYSFIPGVEYALLPGSSVRPFFAAGLGVGGQKNEGDADLLHMILLLQGGAHLFATDSFSFDGMLGFAYLNGSVKQGGGADDLDLSGFRFMITLGISGWIGGGSADPQPAGGQWAGAPASTQGGTGGGWQGGAGGGGTGAPPAQGGTASPVQRSGEWMTASTSVGGHTLEAYAKPSAGTDDAGLRLTTQGSPFARCMTMILYRGDGSTLQLPLQHQGGGAQDVMVAQTTLSVLETWAGDPQASLGLCDQRWPLGADARATVRNLVESVRGARGAGQPAGGGWNAPPPAEQPPAEQPSPGQPPAEQPPAEPPPPLPDPEQGEL